MWAVHRKWSSVGHFQSDLQGYKCSVLVKDVIWKRLKLILVEVSKVWMLAVHRKWSSVGHPRLTYNVASAVFLSKTLLGSDASWFL